MRHFSFLTDRLIIREYIRSDLDDFLEVFVADLVEQQGEDDRRGEVKTQIEEADQEGVSDQLPELAVFHKFADILQPYPGAAPDRAGGLIFPEGDLHAVHGPVLEDDQVNQRDGY